MNEFKRLLEKDYSIIDRVQGSQIMSKYKAAGASTLMMAAQYEDITYYAIT
jgi:hypothetical protein